MPEIPEEKVKIKRRTTKEIEYLPEYADVAQRMVASGYAAKDIAYNLGISLSTLNRWKRTHPDLKTKVNNGKELTLGHLIISGIKRGEGYDWTKTTIESVLIVDPETKKEVWKEVKKKETKEHVPGDSKIWWPLVCSIAKQLGYEGEWINKRDVEENRHIHIHEDISRGIDELAGKFLQPKLIESTVVNTNE
jgi:hypothetical protein